MKTRHESVVAAGSPDKPRGWVRTAGCCLVLLAVTYAAAVQPRAAAETRVKTYFENTDHELTVYFITGKEPGNTMMIIGGIQGDEPGGYIAADLYADMLLEKGNLIVVPRANLTTA